MHLIQIYSWTVAMTGAVTCIDMLMNNALCSGGADRTVHLWNWTSW